MEVQENSNPDIQIKCSGGLLLIKAGRGRLKREEKGVERKINANESNYDMNRVRDYKSMGTCSFFTQNFKKPSLQLLPCMCFLRKFIFLRSVHTSSPLK